MLRSVTLLLVEQMMLSSITIAVEMLEATRARLRLQRQQAADFHIQVACQPATDLARVCVGGLRLQPDVTIDEVEQTDLIVVPALWRDPQRIIRHNRPLIDWIAARYQQGAAIISVGTGVCLVAESGILDGKPATTHWHYQDRFASHYPAVLLQRQHLLTQSQRIYCAASVNSGADSVIHFIGKTWGREMALQVEQQFSPEIRNPFENRVYSPEDTLAHADEEIVMAQAWMRRYLREPFSLALLAQRAGLSERQFSRRFKQATGVTPLEYFQTIRCQAARELLQQSNLTVADIALAVGFGDSSYFIRIFRRLAGQSPGEYRDKVRGKLFTDT
ncbi:GlxA family transcriptional regulator [Oceanobacter mangrovi]|uniref:GlxA family transcriptional regulator n=1 Tax=Oceanobacter mangrovi TaxID=2862510 RepID=UPI001C8D6C0E|nr:helix-turn-helix domain-containing protein [Oceanobacter mangrovi]